MLNKRHAITFDPDLHEYIENIAAAREESFSAVCASMLREIMRDDLTAERKH